MNHPARRPFPEGNGFFETMRTQGGQVAELTRHMRRALTASVATGIKIPGEEYLRAEIAKVLQENPHAVGRLRICFSNDGVVITHDEYADLTEGGYLTFSVVTSKAVGEQFKTYPYDSHYEVVDEARAHGFDDAMIFNKENNVTETGLSNLAFLFDGTWFTPPISAGILPGTMRSLAIEKCGVQVRNIHITEVPQADEIYLLSSLKIAQPVVQVGEMRFPCGDASQAFGALMREKVEYFSVV
jgi:branched-subunit amino acid aminotransferase/4-amino-4-deoxychorismate lyase